VIKEDRVERCEGYEKSLKTFERYIRERERERERENLALDFLTYLEPVERSYNRSKVMNVVVLVTHDSTSSGVQDKLKTIDSFEYSR